MARFRTRLAALTAAAFAIHHPASAQPLRGSDDFPRSRDAATVGAWLSERSAIPPEAVVVAGPDAVFAVLPSGGMSTVPQGRRVRVMQEVVDPGFVPTLGGRSAVLELDVDCARLRVMRQAFDIYAGSNMTGSVERLGAARSWSIAAEPDTPMGIIVGAVCDPAAAPHPLAGRAQLAEAVPRPALRSPAAYSPAPAMTPAPVQAEAPRAAGSDQEVFYTTLPPPTGRGASPPRREPLVTASPASAPPAVISPRPAAAPIRPPPQTSPPRPAAQARQVAPPVQAPPPPPRSAAVPMLNLGEYTSLETARAAWASAAGRSPGKVQRIELAHSGGVLMYRALVDGFTSVAEAEAACAAYRARGGRCSLR